MPDELSRYQKHCREVCPDGCGRGMRIFVVDWKRVHQIAPNDIPCRVTMDRDEFYESESRRADEERQKREAAEAELERFMNTGLKASLARINHLEQERDSLKAQLAGAAVCKRCMVTAFPDCPSCGGRGVVLGGEKAR